MSHWRNSTARADVMRGTGEDEAAYVAGWTVRGVGHTGNDLGRLGFCDLASWNKAQSGDLSKCAIRPAGTPITAPVAPPRRGRFFCEWVTDYENVVTHRKVCV
jgi:hypothetical protein